jgi:hypothetical protein
MKHGLSGIASAGILEKWNAGLMTQKHLIWSSLSQNAIPLFHAQAMAQMCEEPHPFQGVLKTLGMEKRMGNSAHCGKHKG